MDALRILPPYFIPISYNLAWFLSKLSILFCSVLLFLTTRRSIHTQFSMQRLRSKVAQMIYNFDEIKLLKNPTIYLRLSTIPPIYSFTHFCYSGIIFYLYYTKRWICLGLGIVTPAVRLNCLPLWCVLRSLGLNQIKARIRGVFQVQFVQGRPRVGG